MHDSDKLDSPDIKKKEINLLPQNQCSQTSSIRREREKINREEPSTSDLMTTLFPF